MSTSEVLRALLNRPASPPESTVEIGVTAKRLHTWTVTVRGADPEECDRVAQRIEDGLAAKYASELDTDTLGSDLARSIVAQEGKRT